MAPKKVIGPSPRLFPACTRLSVCKTVRTPVHWVATIPGSLWREQGPTEAGAVEADRQRNVRKDGSVESEIPI